MSVASETAGALAAAELGRPLSHAQAMALANAMTLPGFFLWRNTFASPAMATR